MDDRYGALQFQEAVSACHPPGEEYCSGRSDSSLLTLPVLFGLSNADCADHAIPELVHADCFKCAFDSLSLDAELGCEAQV